MDFLFELNARKRIAISQDVELILPQVKTDFALILFFLTIGLAGPKSLIYLVPKISLFFHALQLSLTALTNSSKIHSCIDFENSRCQSWHQIKKQQSWRPAVDWRTNEISTTTEKCWRAPNSPNRDVFYLTFLGISWKTCVCCAGMEYICAVWHIPILTSQQTQYNSSCIKHYPVCQWSLYYG